jgi:hypothetical protein
VCPGPLEFAGGFLGLGPGLACKAGEGFVNGLAGACGDAVDVTGSVAGGPDDRVVDGDIGHSGTVVGQLGRRSSRQAQAAVKDDQECRR